MEKKQSVKEYIEKNKAWEPILSKLRAYILDSGLSETVKWGMPTYVYNKKNIVGLGAFKSHACLWFFQGALINDKEGFLVNAQSGKTKAMRQWRILSEADINEKKIKAYIRESINNEANGKRINPDKKKELIIPELLRIEFEKNLKLKDSFNTISLTKRREFADYITEAKQDTTKLKRLTKIVPMIIDGVGLNDKYRK